MEDRIVVDPTICNGRPTVRGTRVTVQTVLEFLGAGDAVEDVLEEYPFLTREDVLACLRFSSQLMGNQFTMQKVA
jgi:uncharacterized protein (DUF433 family)